MSQEQQVACGHCEATFPQSTAIADAYCSRRCYYRDKGQGILDDLEHDHTICSTCFATLKETSHPGDDRLERAGVSPLVREAFVGFEHHTEHARNAADAPPAAERDALGVLRETATHAPTACQCGAIERDRDETVERVEGASVLLNLWGQLARLFSQGAIDTAPSKDRLFDGLREAGERDWAFAIGYSLHGGDT